MNRRSLLLLFGVTVATGLIWLWVAFQHTAKNEDTPDIQRQWLVSQYVRARVNPYPLSLAALREVFGPPQNFTREVPQTVSPELTAQLLPGATPPEATYPPPATALFSVTIGLLPEQVLLAVWIIVNGLCLAFIVVRLADVYPPRREWPTLGNICFVAWLCLLYNATFRSVEASQFALPVMAALLHGTRPGVSTLSAGLAWTVALIKPSLSLPFLVLLINQRRWAVLLSAAGAQLLLWFALAAWLQVNPLDLLRGWLRVAPYFMISNFGIQPTLVALGWVGHWQGTVATLFALLVVMALGLLLGRWQVSYREQFAFLGLGSLLWTYHLGYDFVILLPALLLLFSAAPPGSPLLCWHTIVVVLLAYLVGLACFFPKDWLGAFEVALTALVRWGMLVSFAGWAIWLSCRRSPISDTQP